MIRRKILRSIISQNILIHKHANFPFNLILYFKLYKYIVDSPPSISDFISMSLVFLRIWIVVVFGLLWIVATKYIYLIIIIIFLPGMHTITIQLI